MAVCDTCYRKVKRVIAGVFRVYGEFVGRHPVWFIVLPIVIFGGLGVGMVALDEEKDIEKVYFPKNSRAIRDRQYVRDTFPDLSNVSYNAFSQSDPNKAVVLLFKSKSGQTIFDTSTITEIAAIVNSTKSLSSSGKTYSDVCAKSSTKCLVDGEIALDPDFQSAVAAGTVSYPFHNNVDLRTSISGETVNGGKLVKATVLRFSFTLAENAEDWNSKFLAYAEDLDPTYTEVTYETPESLAEELDKNTSGYILLFSVTITLCCIYASVVSTGGNPVSTRGMLAFGGILAAGLGIVGSMGLLSACGVKFVNIVGVVPFLIIGIGVDDVFLLMSSWSENLPSDVQEQTVQHVPKILGKALASAGIGITITSVTDFLAFVIGTTSVFMSVTNFSLYAGVAVLFCYLANVTLFSGCLAIHGRRVYSWRHSYTCRVTKSRDDLKKDGRSACFAVVCGGSPPKKERDDKSLCEKFPSKFLPYFIKNNVVSVMIIVLFLGYLSAAIYGIIQLKQGLVLKNLVLDTSYYYRFSTLSDEYFPIRIPVAFVVNQKLDYAGNDGTLFLNLLSQARNDAGIDSSFERCWLSSFKSSASYSSSAFVNSVQSFLTTNMDFKADIVFDGSNSSVTASRCFVVSKPNNDQHSNAELMVRMQKLADASSLSVFAYHSSFVTFEQSRTVLPATLQMVGSCVAVMTVVTFLFLPHILMVLLVVLTIVMILVGIFGFMYFFDLTLSSITMIHLVMSVGFSVDFSAHVCTAYLMSDSMTRQDRARDAIRHAAGPILNGATSTLLGIVVLAASSSYIFQSFFKIMLLVIVFGMLHAIFFLPAVLALLGPENRACVDPDYNGETTNVHTLNIYTSESVDKRFYF